MSEQTITSPIQPEVQDHEAHGSERPRRRTAGEIQDSLTSMLRGEYAQPQEEEQNSESELEDGIEEEAIEAESYEDSEEVEEVSENNQEEYSEGEPSSYRVIIDGKEMDVPLDELISGYQKGSSFTQKSQALAEERKEFEATARLFSKNVSRILKFLHNSKNTWDLQVSRTSTGKLWKEKILSSG